MKLFKVMVTTMAITSVACVYVPFAVVSALRQQVRGGPEQFSAEMQALRRDGLPTTPEQLQRLLPPPDRNAAIEYSQITEQLKQRPLPEATVNLMIRKPSRESLTPQQVESVRALLTERADLLRIIHRAARKPECVFQHEWSLGPEMSLPYLGPMRQVGRLITGESLLMALDGHYSQAVANQAEAFRIAEHSAADSLYIGYLVGIAIDAVALNGMSQLLHMVGPNAAVDRQIERAVSTDSPQLSLANGLKSEISSSLAINHLIQDKGLAYVCTFDHRVVGGAIDQYALNGRTFDRELADALAANMLDGERLLYEAASLPPSQRRAAYAATVSKLTMRLQGRGTNEILSTAAAANVLPVFTSAEDRLDRVRDSELVVRAAAAVMAFRAERGKFPPGLGEAMNPVPPDHFQGQPLGYHLTADGFVVFSRGQDGFDPGTAPVTNKQAVYFCYP